jgi:indolepyruvate ferredoxin oxidoreductase
MPATFIRDRDFVFPGQRLVAELRSAAQGVAALDATRLASALLGDSIGANVMLLGFAFQRGLLPVSGAALYRALELYGRNVEENKLAFDWGRFAAEQPEEIERLATAKEGSKPIATSVQEVIARRAEFLVGYQDRAYSQRYRALLDRVAAAEQRERPGSQALLAAVAHHYFSVLAYKDEYEVARLHTQGDFIPSIKRNFGAGVKMSFHLSPPLLARRDPATGRPKKYELGPWILPILRVLAKLKWLRGRALDPFARSADRRLEREWLARYERIVERIVTELDASRFDIALELAELPRQVRGYGMIKSAAAARASAAEQALWARWEATAAALPRATAA